MMYKGDHDFHSLSTYESACLLSESLVEEDNDKSLSSAARIRTRVASLERVAIAATAFASIQDAKVNVKWIGFN